MADRNMELQLQLTANDQASAKFKELNAQIADLQAQIVSLQAKTVVGAKDWLDYAQQTAETGESLTEIVNDLEDIAIKGAIISAGLTVYKNWKSLVDTVKNGYVALQGAIDAATLSGKATAGSAWDAITSSASRLSVKLADLTASWSGLSTLAAGLETAGIALTLAAIGEQADASNQQVRAMIEQVGGLGKALQDLDPASKPVQIAKERYEELYKASLQLKQSTEELVGPYQKFFDDVLGSGLGSVQRAGRVFTDINATYQSLRASAGEVTQAQQQITEAFDKGITTTAKLGQIFGSALNPALDLVAANMGVSRDQLKNLIDTAQVGSESVIPALAAAARTVTQPLNSAGDAATFSSAQFKAMGISAFDLADKALPGVANALDHTGKAIAATIDGSVDPIGAAVEQIQIFGQKVVDWATLTKQSITEALQGPDIAASIKTGLQEAVYALDYLLVGLKEETVAVGESLGVLAGAATTASNPLDALSEIWLTMSDRLMATRDHLQEYINALEGVDNASARTAQESQAMKEALQTIPEINLPEALQEIVDKLNSTQSASAAVSAVWKELGQLDFTGQSIRNLLLLRQSIDDVSSSTGDATATQIAFAKELSNLPTDTLAKLLAKVTELSPRLKEAGDDGTLLKTVLSAVFDQLGLDAAQAGNQITAAGEKAAAAFKIIATSADTTGQQVRAALDKALDATKTTADVELIRTAFNNLAAAGQLSGKLMADGQLAILDRLRELTQATTPVEKAFSELGVKSAASLRQLADVANAAFKDLQVNGGVAIGTLRTAFLAWADAELKAAQAADLSIPATIRHQAATLGLSDALDLLIQKYPKLDQEQDAHIALTEKSAKAAQNMVSGLEAVANAQIQGLQQEIALANAKGLTYTAYQKSIELAKTEAEWQATLAGARQALIAAERDETEAKLVEKKAIEEKTAADYAEIHALELKLIAQGKQAEVQALVQQLAQQRLDKLEQGIQVDQKAAEATNKATQGFVEQTRAAEENSQTLANNKKETEAFALLQKQLTEYLNGARQRMDDLSASARLYFEAMLEGTLAANAIQGAAQGSLAATQAWTNATREGSDAIAEFSGKIAAAGAQIGAARQDLLFAADDMRVWISAISLSEAATTKAFYEQAQSAEQLRLRIKDLSESGRIDIGTLTQASQEAKNGFRLLDDEDLANLRAEIDRATQKLEEMQQATEDARARLSELNVELLEARGEDKKADLLRQQLDYQTRLAEIEKQRQEAELLGNRELVAILDKQAAVLRQINDAKIANINSDQDAQKSGDKVAHSWDKAATAIRSTGAALSEVHNLGIRVAEIDLSGLRTNMAELAFQANKLREVL